MIILVVSKYIYRFSGGSVVKNPPANAGDIGSVPRSRRSPGEGNGNLVRYSCLENPMDREVWWATVHRVTKKSDITEQLNNNKLQNLSNGFTSAFCISHQ